MKERPILFKGRLVQAILAGKKSQTRRIVKPQPEAVPDDKRDAIRSDWWWSSARHQSMILLPEEQAVMESVCPYGQPGDRLWVRESAALYIPTTGDTVPFKGNGDLARPEGPGLDGCGQTASSDYVILYRAGYRDPRLTATEPARWCPSIHMPRWASRLTLEVAGVRVERIQSISEADILAEGCDVPTAAALTGTPWSDIPTLWYAWRAVWCHVNGQASWDANPWVWAITFKVVER